MKWSARWFACVLVAGLTVFGAAAWGAPIASLAWNSSPDSGVAGYKIYIGTNSHNYDFVLDVGNVSSASIELPDYDTAYYFVATSYSVTGVESDFSDETSYVASSLSVTNGSNTNTDSGSVSNSVTTTNSPVTYQAPTLSPLNDVSISGTDGTQSVPFTGVTTGSGATVTITATSSNPSLIPNPAVNYLSPNGSGSLAFAPAANTSGSAVITVTVNNGQPQNNLATQTFTVSVTKVYQAPALNSIGNISIAENAGWQTVAFSGLTTGSGSSATVTATSSNPGLIPNPTVSYTSPNSSGTLKFSPATNANGTATITVTVTVNNGQPQNSTATQTFTVNVAPVNQPPTLDSISNLALAYNSAAQTVNLTGISSGASDELQALTVQATSSNTKLISTPTVSYSSPLSTGTLTIQPASNVSGSAVITVTVSDGGASNNIVTRTFTVTVATNTVVASSGIKLTSQPSSQVVVKGKSASFKVSATGTGTLKYQWKLNGKNIAGATKASLSLKNCQSANAGDYTVTVSNTKGAITSSPAALIVSATPAALLAQANRTNGNFSFGVVGVAGAKYVVQASTDMVKWTSVRTNAAPFTFTDTNSAAVPGKFFRTVYFQ